MIEGRYSGFRGYIHWQATRRAESNRYSGIVQAGGRECELYSAELSEKRPKRSMNKVMGKGAHASSSLMLPMSLISASSSSSSSLPAAASAASLVAKRDTYSEHECQNPYING